MEAPKCKVCQKRHYGSCGGFARSSKKVIAGQQEAVKSLLEKHGLGSVPEKPSVESPRDGAEDTPLICPTCGRKNLKTQDRKSYQKAYMREYRKRK